jgi:hypothetical protein
MNRASCSDECRFMFDKWRILERYTKIRTGTVGLALDHPHTCLLEPPGQPEPLARFRRRRASRGTSHRPWPIGRPAPARWRDFRTVAFPGYRPFALMHVGGPRWLAGTSRDADSSGRRSSPLAEAAGAVSAQAAGGVRPSAPAHERPPQGRLKFGCARAHCRGGLSRTSLCRRTGKQDCCHAPTLSEGREEIPHVTTRLRVRTCQPRGSGSLRLQAPAPGRPPTRPVDDRARGANWLRLTDAVICTTGLPRVACASGQYLAPAFSRMAPGRFLETCEGTRCDGGRTPPSHQRRGTHPSAEGKALVPRMVPLDPLRLLISHGADAARTSSQALRRRARGPPPLGAPLISSGNQSLPLALMAQRPSRRMDRMCESCVEIDKQIEQHRDTLRSTQDENEIERIKRLIASLYAGRVRLHRNPER